MSEESQISTESLIAELRDCSRLSIGYMKTIFNDAADRLEKFESLPKIEPIAYTSTKQLENMSVDGEADMWFPFDVDFDNQADEIGSDSKQVALYTHPLRQQEPIPQAELIEGWRQQMQDMCDDDNEGFGLVSFINGARFVERKYGIGG